MIKLRRGINLGGYLSQCVHTRAHYDSFISRDDFCKIKEMGFDHVRLPIDYEVFETESGNRIEEGFKRVHGIIDLCRQNDLNIILDIHKAYGYDFNDANDVDKNNLFSNSSLQDRFVDLWKSIAGEFAKYDNVAFELLNEVVEDENAKAWNELISRTVAEIRLITDSTTIIYGGIRYNSADAIDLLETPVDDNIIFTFHFYEPLVFTHQRAHWMDAMSVIDSEIGQINYPGDKAVFDRAATILDGQDNAVLSYQSDVIDIEYLRNRVSYATESARSKGVSLYVGEFGVIDRAPTPDTLRWFKDIMQVFNENDIGCALWSYKDMDFGLNESHYDDIREDILTTLLG